MKVVLILIILFFVLFIIWDFNRFNKVYNAKTPNEIEIACQEYQGVYVNSTPIKCVKYLTK